MKPLTLEWVAKGEGDYRVVLLLMRAKQPVHDAICYHAQQCVEKYLKAWLIEQGMPAPKIHDLETLVKLCLPSMQELSFHIDGARYLSVFAVEVRYPGSFAGESEARASLKLVRSIRKLLRTKLNI